ncbi:MAG: hypothetical protein R3C56_40420 [Pirellulaceae bacterium]
MWREVEQRRDWQDEVSALSNLITSASMAAGEDLTSPIPRRLQMAGQRGDLSYLLPLEWQQDLRISRRRAHRDLYPWYAVMPPVLISQWDAEQVVTRLDPEVNFEWSLGSPVEGFPERQLRGLPLGR